MEWLALVTWLLVVAVIWGLALPATSWLVPRGHAPALALPLGLAVVGVVGHLVGHLAFGLVAVGAGLATLVVTAGVTYRRVTIDRRRIGEAVAVFTVGFALIVGIRAIDPSAGVLPHWVGEKFLDFGLLASLDRAATLPPEDMWFAGEPVRYYYGGHMLTSLLASAAGAAPALAYNLGLATFYGALVTAAWGVASSIARAAGTPRRLGAALGAFFVGVAANLETALRVVGWLLPRRLTRDLVDLLDLDVGLVSWSPADFDYFDASRVIPVDPTAADPYLAATEFPLFAWLNGDLHAHMMSQPLLLLVVGLCVAAWVSAPADRVRRHVIVVGVIPPVVGLLSLTNLWSFPTAGGLVALTVFLSPTDPTSWLPARLGDQLSLDGASQFRVIATRAAVAVATALVVLVVAVIWVLPFWMGPLLGGTGYAVTLWDHQTSLGPFLVVTGAFIAVIVVALARWLRASTDAYHWPVLVVATGFAGCAVLGMPVVGLALGLIGLTWWLAHWSAHPIARRPDEVAPATLGFAAVLIVGGAGLVLLVEVFTLEGDRFNSIFKPYAHVWLLWSTTAGVLLAGLVAGWPGMALGDPRRLRRVGSALMVVLVMATGIYAGLALPAHVDDGSAVLDDRGPTLNATAYVEVHYAEEAPAIRYLQDQPGRQTLLTGAPGGYWWAPSDGEGAAAPASLTGHPTVLGWYHERQYRGDGPYETRLEAVRELYTGETGRQSALLAAYGVDIVYLGPAERARYLDVTIDDHPAVDLIGTFGSTELYTVDHDALG